MKLHLIPDAVSRDVADGNWIRGSATGSSEAPASYVILQRSEYEESDQEICIEFHDQARSGYGLVAQATYSPQMLGLVLVKPVGDPAISSIDIALDSSQETRVKVDHGVHKILVDVLTADAATTQP